MTKSRDLGDLAQTVAVNLPASLGTAGQTLVVNSGADGLELGAASGGGVTVYTGLSGTDGTPSGATYLLNASSPSAGDLAYVSSNTSLYQNNGNGWYRIAVINTTPTISSVADASSNTTPFTLEGGTNTVITVTASDAEEGTDLTYTHSVTSGSLNGTTVTQGTGANENVFTIAPHASNSTTFSITFSVSDSINAATSVAAFTLEFVVTDSHYTSLLMATDGSAGDNSTITYDTGSSTGNSLTVAGDAHASTFSPYRHGGYSASFDGSSDWLTGPTSLLNFTIADKSTEAATIEAWVYHKGRTSPTYAYHNQAILGKGDVYFNMGINGSGNISFYHYDGSARYLYSAGTVPLNTWTHVAATISGGTVTLYINGSADSNTGTWYGIPSAGQNTATTIGRASTNASSNYFNGYISDLRVIEGAATAPPSGGPTERLIAVTNTSLLTCHLPYFKDGSSNDHSITVNGGPETRPFGPYDYEQYSEATNGGSVYFDGGDYLTATGTAIGSGNFSLEAWVNPASFANYRTIFTNRGTSNSSSNFVLGVNSSGQVYLYSGSFLITASITLKANIWSHVALVRNGTGAGSTVLYINGKSAGSANVSNNFTDTAFDVGGDTVDSNYWQGHISDLRVSNSAVYTGEFTPPTAVLSSTGTNFHMKGTDAHVIDKSQGNNLKLIGTTAASTTQAKFSNTASVYFDGNSDYITIPDDELFGWGTGSWTFEVWLYITKTGGFNAIFDTRVGTGSEAGSFGLGVHTTGRVQMYSGAESPAQFLYPNDTLSFNTWQHLAIVKDASTNVTKMYFNGTASSTTYSDTRNYGASQPVQIGKDDTTSNYFGGYMQDLRVTKGKARYTSNFTVPSAPLKG